MHHVVTAAYGLGPAVVVLEIGSKERESIAGICAGASQHRANHLLALQQAHGGADHMPRVEQLKNYVAPHEPRAPGDQNLAHRTSRLLVFSVVAFSKIRLARILSPNLDDPA